MTLNPRKKDTLLEARIGLSAAQIRRAVLADLDAIPLPDLATLGERPLAAARAHTPLTLEAPTADCERFRQRIVDLTRTLLRSEAAERVDVEIVVMLSTGMTAFLPQPGEAIAQVGHDLGCLADTLGWARPDWTDTVATFSLDEPRPSARPAVSTSGTPALAAPAPETSPTFALQVAPRPRHRVELPDLSLSDELHARLVWFAVDSGRPLEEALDRLLDFYLDWDADEKLDTMATILELAEALDVAQVDVDTLHDYLQTQTELAEHGCTPADIPEALRLIRVLDDLPEPWGWAQAEAEVEALAALLSAGLDVEEVPTVLARHQQLAALGFDEALAEGMAAALAEAGATGDRRDTVLRELVAQAGQAVDRAELEAAVADLEDELAALEADRDRLRRAGQGLRTRLKRLTDQEAAAQARVTTRRAEDNIRRVGSQVVAFLTRRTPEAAAFWSGLEQYLRARQTGRRPEAPELVGLAATLLSQVCVWFGALESLLQDGPPGDGQRPQGS